MISAAIVTFNEAGKLKKCLQSIKDFADDIVVVDLGSIDDTSKICKEFKVNFFEHKLEPLVEKIRNFSISKTQGDWILVLDPDEEIPEDLKNKLTEIAGENKVAAVNIPRKNIFFGKWIKHTNWWPDRHIRFFRKNSVLWSERIHSYPKVNGETLQLTADQNLAILHFGYDNLSKFLERQNRYSQIESEQRYKSGERFSVKNFIWKPAREFLVRFVKHQGFLDGFAGLSLTYFMMVYQLIIQVKFWELEKQKK